MRTLVLASLPLIMAMSVAFGAKAAEKAAVILGTATPGGGFPIYGQAVAESINEIDTTIEVRPQNTAGSAEKREDPGSDHRGDADERGLSNRQGATTPRWLV